MSGGRLPGQESPNCFTNTLGHFESHFLTGIAQRRCQEPPPLPTRDKHLPGQLGPSLVTRHYYKSVTVFVIFIFRSESYTSSAASSPSASRPAQEAHFCPWACPSSPAPSLRREFTPSGEVRQEPLPLL